MPAQRFLCRPDTAWIGRGTAFSTPKAKRRCTLLVVWYAEQEEPSSSPTCRRRTPDPAGTPCASGSNWASRYQEPGLEVGQDPSDPARISRHWLVLSVATLLALAYLDRSGTPPQAPAPIHRNPWRRTFSVRHGIDWLRAAPPRSALEPRLAAVNPGQNPSPTWRLLAMSHRKNPPCQPPPPEHRMYSFGFTPKSRNWGTFNSVS